MFQKPQFKPQFYVEVAEPDTVYLLSEQGNFVLNGSLYVLLAPLLNGYHTVEEIIEKLKGQVSAAAIYCGLMLLKHNNYIIEADNSLPPQVAAFWNLMNIDTRAAASRLQAKTVSVIKFGTVPTELFVSILESLNILIGEQGDLTVVLTDDYLQVGLDAFNREALASGKPWMLVKPVGGTLWLGPIFYPGKTGCWECLAQRLRGHRELETIIQQQKALLSYLLHLFQFYLLAYK